MYISPYQPGAWAVSLASGQPCDSRIMDTCSGRLHRGSRQLHTCQPQKVYHWHDCLYIEITYIICKTIHPSPSRQWRKPLLAQPRLSALQTAQAWLHSNPPAAAPAPPGAGAHGAPSQSSHPGSPAAHLGNTPWRPCTAPRAEKDQRWP